MGITYLVIDASVALGFFLPDEDAALSRKATQFLKDGIHVFAPGHWMVELTNGLVMAGRRKRLTAEQADRALSLAARLPVNIDHGHEVVAHDAARLARKHGLPAYDAAYLELALRNKAVLATADKALMKAARAEGVALLT